LAIWAHIFEGGRRKEEKCWIVDFGFWVNFRQDLQEGGLAAQPLWRVTSNW
jgi:hypothetical protein